MEETDFTRRFATLPIEQQVAIMQGKPFFRRLNTNYYANSKLAFDEQYCDIDITGKEIFNYVKDEMPDFAVFYINNEIITIKVCIKDEDDYVVYENGMYQDNIDMRDVGVNEYALVSDNNEYRISVDSLLETLIQKDMYVDIKSVQHIIARRGCNNVKQFSIDYLNHIMSMDGTTDIDKLFMQCVKAFYVTNTHDIIKGEYDNISFASDGITFDDSGDVFQESKDAYDDYLLDFKNVTDDYYDSIIKWINNNF